MAAFDFDAVTAECGCHIHKDVQTCLIGEDCFVCVGNSKQSEGYHSTGSSMDGAPPGPKSLIEII